MAENLPTSGSFPLCPPRATPGSGQGPEEDSADSLMDKIGSRPEEQQGRNPGRARGGPGGGAARDGGEAAWGEGGAVSRPGCDTQAALPPQ